DFPNFGVENSGHAAGGTMSAVAKPASFVTVARVIAWRNLHNFITNPALAIPALMFPLFFFAAFAGGLSGVSHVPGFNYAGNYTAFQFSFVVLQASAFNGVFSGFGMARDFEIGFGRRLMLATPNRSAIIAGYAISSMARATFIGVMLFAIGAAAGMGFQGGFVGLIGLIALALGLNVASSFWASGVALRFRSLQAGPLMQVPVFMVLFLTPVYVPYELLSGWVHVVAGVNPVTLVLQTTRGFVAGVPEYIAYAFAAVVGLMAVFLVWALTGMRRAEEAGG
ncbi:MAG: ABC transporter permease, partial [Thermoleophilaceae bacterium]|nr:ABC transporter permease [Thermoleophilaceae bacterium]